MKIFLFILVFTISAVAQTLQGEASFYSVRSNGGTKTASGIPLSDSKLTAASNVYPIGSQVRVSNLKTGRSTTVTITDRGPFATKNGRAAFPLRPHPSRIIDLSVAAFKSIDTHKSGIIKVKTTKIK